MAYPSNELARPLRLVLVWQGEPLETRVLYRPEPVVLGSRKGVTFAIPESIGEYTLLRPLPDGSFSVCLKRGMKGTLGLDRREIAVEDFIQQGHGAIEQPLALHDWGMV